MRLLIISDIHSNLEALEACLDAAPAYDLMVNLGDVVGYGASPNQTIARVRQLGRVHVRGNHDKACSGVTTVDGFNPIAAWAARWTYAALTPENRDWLRALPAGPLAVPGLTHVQFVHGSPLDEDDYLIGLTDALQALLGIPAPVTFFGHSHVQGGFSLHRERGSEIHPPIELGNGAGHGELRLQPRGHYLINPGSVGQPRDGDWRPGFALYDSGARTVHFHRVPYDVERAMKRIHEAALPERLATRLLLGR